MSSQGSSAIELASQPLQVVAQAPRNLVVFCDGTNNEFGIENTSIVRLMQMFPRTGIQQSDIDEFNAQMSSEIEHIRDFIVLHYHVTNRTDTQYWRALRGMSIPASLQHRIDLFRETGRVFRVPNELFAENSWIQVMLGQGILPQQHHPVADLMGDAELAGFLGDIKATVDRTVAQLPSHQAYVEQYCKAPDHRAAGGG